MILTTEGEFRNYLTKAVALSFYKSSPYLFASQRIKQGQEQKLEIVLADWDGVAKPFLSHFHSSLSIGLIPVSAIETIVSNNQIIRSRLETAYGSLYEQGKLKDEVIHHFFLEEANKAADSLGGALLHFDKKNLNSRILTSMNNPVNPYSLYVASSLSVVDAYLNDPNKRIV